MIVSKVYEAICRCFQTELIKYTLPLFLVTVVSFKVVPISVFAIFLFVYADCVKKTFKNLRNKSAWFNNKRKRYLRNKKSTIIECYVNCKIFGVSQIAKYF